MPYQRITPRFIDEHKLTDAEISSLVSRILSDEKCNAGLSSWTIYNLGVDLRKARLIGLINVSKYETYVEHLKDEQQAEAEAERKRVEAIRDQGRKVADRDYIPAGLRKKLLSPRIEVVERALEKSKVRIQQHLLRLRSEQWADGVLELTSLHNQIFQIWKDKLEPLEQFARRERQAEEPATQLEQLQSFIDSVQNNWENPDELRAWIARSDYWFKKLEVRKQRADEKAGRPARELPVSKAGTVDWDKQNRLKANVAGKAYCESRVMAGTPNRGKAVPTAGKSQKELAARKKK